MPELRLWRKSRTRPPPARVSHVSWRPLVAGGPIILPNHGKSAVRAAGGMALLTALALMPLRAADGSAALRLEIGEVAGPGWSAAGVQITLRLADGERLAAEVSAAQ